jgi:hypothetical protein
VQFGAVVGGKADMGQHVVLCRVQARR